MKAVEGRNVTFTRVIWQQPDDPIHRLRQELLDAIHVLVCQELVCPPQGSVHGLV